MALARETKRSKFGAFVSPDFGWVPRAPCFQPCPEETWQGIWVDPPVGEVPSQSNQVLDIYVYSWGRASEAIMLFSLAYMITHCTYPCAMDLGS